MMEMETVKDSVVNFEKNKNGDRRRKDSEIDKNTVAGDGTANAKIKKRAGVSQRMGWGKAEYSSWYALVSFVRLRVSQYLVLFRLVYCPQVD